MSHDDHDSIENPIPMGVRIHLFVLDVQLTVRGKSSASVKSAMGTKLPDEKASRAYQSVGVTAECVRAKAKAQTAVGITTKKNARWAAERGLIRRTYTPIEMWAIAHTMTRRAVSVTTSIMIPSVLAHRDWNARSCHCDQL